MSMPFAYASPEQVMKDKADYARKGVARGKSTVVLEYTNGVMFLAHNPSSTLNKISEIYDRIAFAGVGKYNEYQNLRILGIRAAEVRGYSYSRADVNARSLANSFSEVLGRLFTEAMKPYEVEILIAEVGIDSPNELYRVSFDGTVSDPSGYAAFGGQSQLLEESLKSTFKEGLSLKAGFKVGLDALTAEASTKIANDHIEFGVLDRTLGRRKFRRLDPNDL